MKRGTYRYIGKIVRNSKRSYGGQSEREANKQFYEKCSKVNLITPETAREVEKSDIFSDETKRRFLEAYNDTGNKDYYFNMFELKDEDIKARKLAEMIGGRAVRDGWWKIYYRSETCKDMKFVNDIRNERYARIIALTVIAIIFIILANK